MMRREKNERKEKLSRVHGTACKRYGSEEFYLEQVCFCFHFYVVYIRRSAHSLSKFVKKWNVFLPLAFPFVQVLIVRWKGNTYRICPIAMWEFPKGLPSIPFECKKVNAERWFWVIFHPGVNNSNKSMQELSHLISPLSSHILLKTIYPDHWPIFSEELSFWFYWKNKTQKHSSKKVLFSSFFSEFLRFDSHLVTIVKEIIPQHLPAVISSWKQKNESKERWIDRKKIVKSLKIDSFYHINLVFGTWKTAFLVFLVGALQFGNEIKSTKNAF